MENTELKRLGITETAKRIRQELKDKFPNCVFSVVSQSYSMGATLHVSLMTAPFKVIRTPEEIQENIQHYIGRGYTLESIKDRQRKRYHQLNRYGFYDDWKPENWCNGVFITEEAHVFFKEVMDIIGKYHYDESDSMSDYSNCNFHISLNIGKFEKAFIQPETISQTAQEPSEFIKSIMKARA